MDKRQQVIEWMLTLNEEDLKKFMEYLKQLHNENQKDGQA